MKRIRELYEMGLEKIEGISPAAESDVRLLLQYFCKVSSLDLIINKDKELSDEAVLSFEKAIEKRVSGLPVQYITNEQEFMGLTFYVDERVLIPRGETELLVSRVLEIVETKNTKMVMDVGVGSGAICCSLARHSEVETVIGIDISEDVLAVAKKNAENFGVLDKIAFYHSDVFKNIPDKLKNQVDILISNPPYIPPEEMAILHTDVKKEPELALYGGLDGLDFYREITEEGWSYLKDDGILVYEVGHDQGERVKDLMMAKGFERVEFIEDYQGFKRVVIGYKL